MAPSGDLRSTVGQVRVFGSVPEVVRALVTFTDWWQPLTVLRAPGRRRRRSSGYGDGIRDGLFDTIGERDPS